MSNPRVSDVKYSIYTAPGDGSKTVWAFNFAGATGTPGYIAREHIKAYRTNRSTGVVVQLPLTSDAWITDTTVRINPPVPASDDLTIYRDTPKDMPLVDYTTTSIINERNLDKANRQAIYVAAEMVDQFLVVKDVSDAAIILANQAIVTADAAVVTANSSTAASSAAVITANAANATAAAAEVKADAAVLTANAAKATAEGIDGKAQDALDTAGRAETKANAAVATANAIDGKAQNALDTAALADSKASAAVATANAAKATAEGVDAKATTAIATANSANTKADTAVTTANEAKSAVANKQDALGFTPVKQEGSLQVTMLYDAQGWLSARFPSGAYGQIPSLSRECVWSRQHTFNNALVLNSSSEYKVLCYTGATPTGRWSSYAGVPFGVVNAAATSTIFAIENNGNVSVSGGVTAAGFLFSNTVYVGPGPGGQAGRIYLRTGAHSRYMDINPDTAMLNFANAAQTAAVGQLSDGGVWYGLEFRPSSDARLKDEWQFFGEQFVSKLAKVKAGTYRLKRTDARSIGVEAQSLREVMPDAVGVGDDGYLNVNVGGAAMAAVVYLAREIEALKARIAALEATN